MGKQLASFSTVDGRFGIPLMYAGYKGGKGIDGKSGEKSFEQAIAGGIAGAALSRPGRECIRIRGS